MYLDGGEWLGVRAVGHDPGDRPASGCLGGSAVGDGLSVCPGAVEANGGQNEECNPEHAKAPWAFAARACCRKRTAPREALEKAGGAREGALGFFGLAQV